MSNSIIPHLLSDSPPPIAANVEEDYDDEFGDFTGPGDFSFDNENSSMPSTPKNTKNFSESYPSFEISSIENDYEINKRIEDKSPIGGIENEPPTKKFINILDHIENNITNLDISVKENELKVTEKFEKVIKDSLSLKTSEDEGMGIETEANTHSNKNGMCENSYHEAVPVSNEHIEGLNSFSNFPEVNAKSGIENKLDEPEIEDDSDFGDFSAFTSVNKNDVSEFSSDHEELEHDGLKKIKDHNDNSLDNFKTQTNSSKNIAPLEIEDVETNNIEALESESLPVFNLEEDNDVETEFNRCEVIEKESIFMNSIKLCEFEDRSYDLYRNNEQFCEKTIEEKIEIEKKSQPSEEVVIKKDLDLNIPEKNIEQISPVVVANECSIMPSNLDNCEILKNDDNLEEFTDFHTSKLQPSKISDEEPEANDSVLTKGDNLATFRRFKNYVDTSELTEFKNPKRIQRNKNEVEENSQLDDEFDDFASYSTCNQDVNYEDDDFDSFSDYSTFNKDTSDQSENSQISDKFIKICKNPEEAFEQAQIVLENVFEAVQSDVAEYSKCDFTMNNSVYENLKDITETNALNYQWGKSTAQKNILKTLNIDIRNILYGPSWSDGVPIFAANLCSTPLEPIKSDIPFPLSPQKVMQVQEPDHCTINTEIPVVEFDWNSAGLTNPLDYSPTMLLDLGEIIVDCPVNMSLQEWDQPNSALFDEWGSLGFSFDNAEKQMGTPDLSKTTREPQILSVTPSTSVELHSKLPDAEKDIVSVSSLQLTEYQAENAVDIEENNDTEDDFGDFESCQPKYEKERDWSDKMLPLRESHIFYQPPGISPSISVTEAKTKSNIDTSLNINFDLSLLESKIENWKSKDTNSDFGTNFNFHNELKSLSSSVNELEIKETLPAFDDFKSFHQKHNVQESTAEKTIEENHCSLPHTSSILPETVYRVSVPEISNFQEDDEFTDFHSSLPSKPELPSALSFQEPLQPSVLQPIQINNQSITKIDWPEPGLDEEEINRIVIGCLRSNSEEEKVKDNQEQMVHREEHGKQIVSNDDEEWSDFVSVKEPVKSRTATPDLPLSVFNLGNIQPVKVPTPLVTPNGLVSSPVKKTMPNMTLPKSNANSHKNVQSYPQQHPFITSQAFDALYQNPKNNLMCGATNKTRQGANPSCKNCGNQPEKIVEKYLDINSTNIGIVSSQTVSYGNFQKSSASVPKNSVEDDDWGEFVSATNAPTFSNSNLNPLQSSTRIITNPSHNVVAFNSKSPHQQYSSSSRGVIVRQERRNIPSISALPEMEFVSPKSRGVKK